MAPAGSLPNCTDMENTPVQMNICFMNICLLLLKWFEWRQSEHWLLCCHYRHVDICEKTSFLSSTAKKFYSIANAYHRYSQCMEQLQQLSASVHALNGRSWENNAFSSLSVMEAFALCAMHCLRQRNKLSNRMCLSVCVCVCASRLIQNNGVKSSLYISSGHMVKPALLVRAACIWHLPSDSFRIYQTSWP